MLLTSLYIQIFGKIRIRTENTDFDKSLILIDKKQNKKIKIETIGRMSNC